MLLLLLLLLLLRLFSTICLIAYTIIRLAVVVVVLLLPVFVNAYDTITVTCVSVCVLDLFCFSALQMSR